MQPAKSKILNLLIIAVVILFCIPAILVLVRSGFFTMYDDMQVIRLDQMDKCFGDGQIPCRWVPDLGYGYGYPLYMYYAPFPYYVMELVHMLGFSFIDSVKFGFGLSVIASGVFFFLFIKYFLNTYASIFATVLYIYAPFRAADLYVRGAMGELWGLFALPFVLWGFERLLVKKNKASVGIFGLSLAVYLTTHNLTVIMTLPLVILWILLRIIASGYKKNLIKATLLGGLMGLAASSFFWLPLVFERNLVWLETLTQGYFNYLAHFISLKQIFLATRWGYGSSIDGPSDDAMLGLGPIGVISAILGIFVGLLSKKDLIKKVTIFFAVFFLVGAYLSHGRSAFIWSHLKFLEYLQFPWRFIFLATFASSALGGIFVNSLKAKQALVSLLVLIIAIIAIYGSYFKPKDWFIISDKEKLSGQFLERQLTASIYDYLPKSASSAPTSQALNSIVVQDGNVTITEFKKGTNWYEIKVNAQTNTEIALPTYSFPVWRVEVNGQKVETKRVGELGLVGFDIPDGDVFIKAVLTKTSLRKLGDIISILAGLSIIYLLVYEKITRKT